MPKRAMRRSDLEITDVAEMESILARGLRCCIGVVDDGEPYVVPVCYGYEKDRLYFHSADEGKKMDALRKDNRVAFEVDTDLETAGSGARWTMHYRSVMGKGTAHVVDDSAERAHALELIMQHYVAEGDYHMPEKLPESVAVVRIDVESLTGKQSGYPG